MAAEKIDITGTIIQAGRRIKVVIERRDGKKDTVEAIGPAQIGPGVVLIPMASNRMRCYSYNAIVYWESSESDIAVARQN